MAPPFKAGEWSQCDRRGDQTAGRGAMRSEDTPGKACDAPQLLTTAVARESGRARQLLTSGDWRPTDADADAAARVLARLAAPLPARGRQRTGASHGKTITI